MGVGTHAEAPGAPWRPPDPISSPAGLLHQHGQARGLTEPRGAVALFRDSFFIRQGEGAWGEGGKEP